MQETTPKCADIKRSYAPSMNEENKAQAEELNPYTNVNGSISMLGHNQDSGNELRCRRDAHNNLERLGGRCAGVGDRLILARESLSEDQKKGVRVGIYVNLLVLLVFLVVLATGHPIAFFQTTATSVVYSIAVYLPVMVLCAFAYRRLRQR